MTFIGPSQREQTMTSTANTRFSRAAQSRRYADRGGDGFDDAHAGDAWCIDDTYTITNVHNICEVDQW